MKVLAIATLDTKGRELQYLVEEMEKGGLEAVTLDSGVMGEPFFAASITREEVAEKGGGSLDDLQATGDRFKAVSTMSQGSAAFARELFERGEIAGVIAVGGSSGAAIATAAMLVLPFGVPKLLISPAASKAMETFVATKDVTILNSVIDIEGLNRISRKVLSNGARAMGGMLAGADAQTLKADSTKLVAATMMGVTTPCVSRARHAMEEHGLEVVVFPAIGSGGKALESMIEDGLVDGVLDMTTGEIANHLVGGTCDAGPNRLGAAGKKGVPQVVSCGALDFVNFLAGRIPDQFKARRFHEHNPAITLMRTTAEENRGTGRAMAEKLNLGTADTLVMIPLQGFSALDVEGGPFWDPEADQAFVDALESALLPGKAEVRKLDLHINAPGFADEAVGWLEDKLH
jgi:uncharacterized protein (UPF0261 family)